MASGDPSQDMIEELVHQFSDPFAFYRELIQNGIDAGSSRIEVVLRYQPGREEGRMVAAVQDWGEGMNREVIENYLLTKFRSSKENDLTKIGKFGIGFMSVFAPDPELVVVDTGRDGEYWRLLFHPDRRYELLRCPEPVEGTRVALHKTLSAEQYLDFADSSKEAIGRWCRHSEAEVTFAAGPPDGAEPGPPQPLRQPLVVDAPFQVEYQEEGTLILAGPARKDPPECGMYNRGLTLLESREPFFPGVSFKIVSRYLEHTLTRDNVRRDRQFERALGLVKKLVEGPLMRQLPHELEKAAAARGAEEDYRVLMGYALGRLSPDGLWFRRASGGAVQGKQVSRAIARTGWLLIAPAVPPGEVDSLISALEREDIPVLALEQDSQEAKLAKRALKAPRVLAASRAYCLARPEPSAEAGPYLAALAELLEVAGGRVKQVALASLQGAGVGKLSICAQALGRPLPYEEGLASPFVRGAPPVLCLNRADERIVSALELGRHSPRLAAHLTFRLLASSHGALDEEADSKATRHSLSR